ncbi:hypothetical protein B5F53_15970 [Blautia sp. An249]|uniref:hypothetical protein n=1 Tax=Blautia sp. An249 TaxID=1965603 RepID=UPI000B37ACF4|nr:hypothetical protein [Blautia sp. An249]OUO76746.1 hypothetical protein B5F53_15970 [Blautia sp. An249]
MSKIVNKKIICACCGSEVSIDRVLSFSSDNIGLSGNKHTAMQYMMEKCPECHYTSLDIEDTSVRVTKGMLNAFRMRPGTEKITDPVFVSILKAADIYEKNKDYRLYAYTLRLASFYAEELQETGLSRGLLKQANEVLQIYFENKEELETSDIMLAIKLIDGNRRLGMTVTGRNMCGEILELIKDASGTEISEIRRLVDFENMLLESRDVAEHFMSEVL